MLCRSLVVVQDLKLLVDVHGQHMRKILAALLRVGDGLGRNLSFVGSAGRNIDYDVSRALLAPVTTVSVEIGVHAV